jgi:ABC-2 type transport system permease protein
MVGVSVALAHSLYRGDLDLGGSSGRAAARARMRLPGAVGALVEKDLRVAWRDPRLKALVFTGVVGPLVLLLFVWGGSGGPLRPALLLPIASFSGLGALGANAFALERRGLGLLFGFPVDRLLLLVGKNVAVIVLRLPALVAVALGTALVAGPAVVPAVAAVVLITQVLATAVDNYLSILFPVPIPAPGRDPNAPVSGTRGLGAAAMVFVAMLATVLASLPFVFLAWLPRLLDLPWLWVVTLPLALAGAAAVHFMATSGAARLLERREPELVARMAGED